MTSYEFDENEPPFDDGEYEYAGDDDDENGMNRFQDDNDDSDDEEQVIRNKQC